MHDHHAKIQQGTITICETGELEVPLHHIPHRATVAFKPYHHHPCDHSHHHEHDHVSWNLRHHQNHCHLVIVWRVQNQREIEWMVEYDHHHL